VSLDERLALNSPSVLADNLTEMKGELMKLKINAVVRGLWSDESAQGATEYILLLAIVVGLAVAFGGKIKGILASKMESISGAMDGFKPESN
jgi:Flp pilus assembly pilin Flp